MTVLNRLAYGVALATAVIFAIPAPAHAWPAPDVPPHRDLYVHNHTGQWAYALPEHPRQVLAPPGTVAAHKMRRAYIDDVFTLHGAKSGRYRVVGITWTPKGAFDLRLHVRGSSRFTFCDRIGGGS